jgi:hypothetical protein
MRGDRSISNREHDYLRDTLVSTYKECIFCHIRTQFTCIKCGYCYSCHWKLEKVESERVLDKYPRPAALIVEQSSTGQQMAIDVYGQQIQPICTYRTCNHRFSEHGHGNHRCHCRHAVNYATGVSISPLKDRDFMRNIILKKSSSKDKSPNIVHSLL